MKKYYDKFVGLFVKKKQEIVTIKKGFGFIKDDQYRVDEHVYLLGFKIKTYQYLTREEFRNRTPNKKKTGRTVVKGFTKNAV